MGKTMMYGTHYNVLKCNKTVILCRNEPEEEIFLLHHSLHLGN